MRTLLSVVVALSACTAPSPLESTEGGMKSKTGDGAATDATALAARLDKLEASVGRITAILEKHPGAASSPAEFEAGRLDHLESQLDKVVAILREAMPAPEPDADGLYAVPIGKDDPIQGPADAKVTIVEGFEFLCPFCAKVNPTVDQILAKYPNDVRLVSKYLIIHGPDAVMPGMAACAAAKQGKFKEMKAALWSKLFKEENGQPSRAVDKLEPSDLDGLAATAGVNLEQLQTDMVGPCRAWIDDSTEVMRPLGATATPAFFINGRFIGGAQPFEAFDAIIQRELAKANDKISGGVAQRDYYASEIVAKGQKKVKGPLDD